MRNTTLKTAAGIITAGKLALVSNSVLADFTDGSKASQLSITQGNTTRWIEQSGGAAGFSTPTPLLEIDQSSSNDSKSASTIFSGAVNLDLFQGGVGEYITESFVVSAFDGKDNGPLDIYLVASPKTSATGWPTTAAGALLIDPNEFEVIGKATITAVESVATPLGDTNLVSENIGSGVVIGANSTNNSPGLYPPVTFSMPIEKQNLTSGFFTENKVHIQAIAFPSGGELDWANATVSSLYVFEYTESGSGSKSGSGSGGK